MPIGPPGQGPKPGPPGKEQIPVEADAAPKPAEGQPKSKSPTPAPAPGKAPTPPVESKPEPAAALAPAQPNASAAPPTGPKAVPTGPKNGRIVPVIPLVATPGQKHAAPAAAPQAAQASQPAANPPQQYRDATQAATAAVAAAMAKLKPQGGAPQGQSGEAAIQNLTQKVAEMRADDRNRHGKPPGAGGFATGPRGGGRGARRGGGRDQQSRPFDVPGTDFDFESSNAKFNKQDLVKEAIATGSPMGTPGEEIEEPNGATNGADLEKESVVIPTIPYNKSSSFFDNISSELKDREDARGKLGGYEFRTEERRKNLETFGQGSVDNYRGGFRGRGRGRGFRGGRGFGRGRGGGGRGRGGAPSAETAGAF